MLSQGHEFYILGKTKCCKLRCANASTISILDYLTSKLYHSWLYQAPPIVCMLARTIHWQRSMNFCKKKKKKNGTNRCTPCPMQSLPRDSRSCCLIQTCTHSISLVSARHNYLNNDPLVGILQRKRRGEELNKRLCGCVCVCVWVWRGGWNCNTDNYIRHANIKQANQLPIGLFRLFIN